MIAQMDGTGKATDYCWWVFADPPRFDEKGKPIVIGKAHARTWKGAERGAKKVRDFTRDDYE